MESRKSPARMSALVSLASRSHTICKEGWCGVWVYGLTTGFTVSTVSSPSSAVSSSQRAVRTTENANVRQALAAMIAFHRVCSPNSSGRGG